MSGFPEPAAKSKPRGTLDAIPRRELIKVSVADGDLPQMRFVAFELNRKLAFLRLFNWLQLLFYFFTRVFGDTLLSKNTPRRRAGHLRRAFELQGGSFIKLGNHLGMRIDLLPWYYSNELSCMVDRVEPFPISEAIAVVERSLKKPLQSVFARFDPQPILSSSTSCTYQAMLHNGEKVAVKVRRPGIGEQFTADIEALDWLLGIAEFLTIFRPGLTKGMRQEFRTLLMEELDFVQEARRQDAFRRAAEKSRKTFFTAPHVYLEYSGEEVMVNAFASGIWLWELLAAIESGDEKILLRAREMNIDPSQVARRLLWVNYWSREENLFFHADPNSNNIIVGQDGRLSFINFTSTGTLSRTRQQAMRQVLYYAWQRDPQNMARSSLILMEPLPPIDLIKLTQELESYNWQMLYALEASPGSIPWQERTSAMQWIGIIEMARKYGILIDIEVLRLLRATLLCESMAMRLDPEINFIESYRKFREYKAEQARRRVTDKILNQLDGKENEQLIIRADRILQTLESLFNRTIHMFTLPSVNFNVLMSKWSFAVYMGVNFFIQVLGVSALALALTTLTLFVSKQPLSIDGILFPTLTNPLYQAVVIMLFFINGRTVLFRMDDKEV
jgi:predicted unusual protein kinase regulating ubiquinone biosynthesis (AarF/ABC1/UbiB family)